MNQEETVLHTELRLFLSVHPDKLNEENKTVQDFISKVGFENLFALILKRDSLFSDDARNAIARIFSSNIAPQLLQSDEIRGYLYKGLDHQSEDIRSFSVQQLEIFLGCAIEIDFLTEEKLLSSLIMNICNDSVCVFENIASLFEKAAKKFDSFAVIFFGDKIFPRLKDCISKSTTIEVRIYSLAIRIGQTSQAAFGLLKSVGILQDFLEKISEPYDILFQAALFEVLGELGESEFGLQFFAESSFLEKLALFALSSSSAESSAHGSYNLIQKLINSSKKFGEYEWMNDHLLTTLLEEGLNADDSTIKASVVTSICSIATCEDGLETTKESGLLNNIPDMVSACDVKTRSAALHGLATIFNQIFEPNSTETAIQLNLLKKTGEVGSTDINSSSSGLDVIMIRASDHSETIRAAALELICEISGQPWGPQKIVDCDGMIRWLKDRQTDFTKSGSEWKFTIIDRLIKNDNYSKSVPEVVRKELELYVEKGVFFVASVQTENL